MLNSASKLRVGMVGMGMIFEETYRHLFEQTYRAGGIWSKDFGLVGLELVAVATQTGRRAEAYQKAVSGRLPNFHSFVGSDCVDQLLKYSEVDVVCIATPDNRHFDPAQKALTLGKHVVIEKPSVLGLDELDELIRLADQHQVLCKVVYHKLADPDHKALRTYVAHGILKHVNSGYCSLLEPKSISQSQFSEWITGRNPATYVAVHYIKLIDFTFAVTDAQSHWRLHRIIANAQQGITLNAWDSVHLQIVYRDCNSREATFDIHTSWVMPNNFPGYVEQEVQFRFDNGIWNAHQRKRGVEVTVENLTPDSIKITPNYHYNANLMEPWNEIKARGYGLDIIERIFHEIAYVEFAGTKEIRNIRLQEMKTLQYNDIQHDRRVVAVIHALEAILQKQLSGKIQGIVTVDEPSPGLWLWNLGQSQPEQLYDQWINDPANPTR